MDLAYERATGGRPPPEEINMSETPAPYAAPPSDPAHRPRYTGAQHAAAQLTAALRDMYSIPGRNSIPTDPDWLLDDAVQELLWRRQAMALALAALQHSPDCLLHPGSYPAGQRCRPSCREYRAWIALTQVGETPHG